MARLNWMSIVAVVCLAAMWCWPGTSEVAIAFGITGIVAAVLSLHR